MKQRTQLPAIAGVIALFALIGLYVREFAVFSNTIHAGRLVVTGMLLGLAGAVFALYLLRRRLAPWKNHLPEYGTILLFSLLFSPLLLSLFNRGLGKNTHESFEFVRESPFYASNYGILKGETIQPTGYRLYVRRRNQEYVFQYRKQAYYPITKPGEKVLLPVRKGVLGFRVIELY